MAQSVGFGACCCAGCPLTWEVAPDVLYGELHSNFNDMPNPFGLASIRLHKQPGFPGQSPLYWGGPFGTEPPGTDPIRIIQGLTCAGLFPSGVSWAGNVFFYPCFQATVDGPITQRLAVTATANDYGGSPGQTTFTTEAGSHVPYTTWAGYHAGIVTEYEPTTYSPLVFHWHTAMKEEPPGTPEFQCLLGMAYHLRITETPPP